MNDNFLQSILKSGLFDIGDSDDRLKWLQQSVTDLVKQLKKKYSLLPKYSLVGLDPNISDQEPIMRYVEVIVTKYWKALRGKFPEMPINIHRGVILNALYDVGMDDPVAARIIYLSILSFYPYSNLNNEKEIVDVLLSELGEVAEKHAVEEWSLLEEEPKLKIGTIKVTDFKFGTAQINQDKLRDEIYQALANSPQGHGPQNGGQSTWGQSFSEKASGAISVAFSEGLAGLNKSITPTSIETPINNFFTTFKKSLEESLKATFSSVIAVERRSKLLWWKETLYSPSLKRSYRGLSKNVIPLIIAYDLFNQVDQITPVSVDYLLRDTLYIIYEKKDEKLKFKDIFSTLSKDPLRPTLKVYFSALSEHEGRICVTDFIALFLNERVKAKDFSDRTGIKEDEEISVSEMSVMIFHDLLIQRLITK